MPYFIFIVNPAAGKGLHTESLCAKIHRYFSARNMGFEIHLTTGPQDALQFVQSYPRQKKAHKSALLHAAATERFMKS